ncbi:hypothetical protein HID58_054527, partial [Brassica napus]
NPSAAAPPPASESLSASEASPPTPSLLFFLPYRYPLFLSDMIDVADLERQRVERRGGHWLGRLLGFCCRSSVRAVLLWSRRLPVKRRWHVNIWRLVSPCRLEVQICKKGVCGYVRSLSRHVRCSMSPPVQGNSGVPLWRHTKARAEDKCSLYFLL